VTLDGPRLEPEGGVSPSGLVILLHGFAANGRQLVPLALEWRTRWPDLAYVAPDAPYSLGSPRIRSWTEPRLPVDDAAFWEGMVAIAPEIHGFLDDQRDRYGLGDARMVLVGFSQGAMTVLHVGLRRAASPAAIIGYSGSLVGPDHVDEITVRPPVTLIHGEDDPIIPVEDMEASAAALEDAGLSVRSVVIPDLGHRLDMRSMEAGAETLRSVFPAS
jgi:phospholipase/carboxylesterase